MAADISSIERQRKREKSHRNSLENDTKQRGHRHVHSLASVRQSSVMNHTEIGKVLKRSQVDCAIRSTEHNWLRILYAINEQMRNPFIGESAKPFVVVYHY